MNKRRQSPLLDRLLREPSSLWIVALSLALATVYWAYTVSEIKSVKDLSVPLQFTNVPKDLIVVGEDARRTLTVEFKGPPDMLKRVREEDVDARIDVAKLKPGAQVIELNREDIRLPSSVEFVRTFPKLVHFSVDRRLRDTVPLYPNFTGHPAPGMQVLSSTIEPASVEVEGPESAIRKLKRIATQPVPLDGRSADFETPVVPTFADTDLTIVTSGPCALKVRIGPRQTSRKNSPSGMARRPA